MAGESRLSEQESGFNTAKRKGIRLSGPLSRAPEAPAMRERGEEMEDASARGEKERWAGGAWDVPTEEGGGEARQSRGAGDAKQRNGPVTSIRSSRERLWQGDGARLLLCWWR